MSLTRTALHAFKWSVLGEAISGAAGPVVFLILARILVPADFGVVAAATVIISISQLFSDAGLRKALVQRQERVDDAASITFWLNVGLALGVMAVLLLAAPLIATFFHDARITAVVRVLSLQVLFSALSAVQITLLQKEFKFRELFWVRLLTSGALMLGSIPLALHGWGHWALVAGALAGQAVQSLVLWLRSAWRPRWIKDRDLTAQLLRFGKWAMLSGLLGWFYAWMDSVIVGHYLGSHDLGLYRTGNTVVVMIYGLIFAPLLPVLYSLFSRAQHDLPRLRDALRTVTHGIAVVALPIAAFLYVLGGPIAMQLFGAKWEGIGRVIAILAVMHGVSWIVGANGEVYRAIGKPHVETWTTSAMLVVYLAGYLISVRFGLDHFLLTRLALALIATVVHILVARVVLGLSIAGWLYAGTIATAIGAALVVHYVGAMLTTSVVTLIGLTALFATLSLTGIALFERTFVRRLIGLVRPGATS